MNVLRNDSFGRVRSIRASQANGFPYSMCGNRRIPQLTGFVAIRLLERGHGNMWNLLTGNHNKKGLRRLDRDQLDRERIRLELAEQRLTREIEVLEQKKDAVFQQGIGAVSDRQRLQLARHIKEIETQIQGKDQQISLVAKNLRAIQSLYLLDDNQQTMSTLGTNSVLKDLDWDEVKNEIDRLQAEQELAANRVASLQQSVSQGNSERAHSGEDNDTVAIFEAMQKAAFKGGEKSVGKEGARMRDEGGRVGHYRYL